MSVEVGEVKRVGEVGTQGNLSCCYEIHTLVLHKRWRAQRLTVVLSNHLLACLTSILFQILFSKILCCSISFLFLFLLFLILVEKNNQKPIGVFTTANPLPAIVPLTCCKYPLFSTSFPPLPFFPSSVFFFFSFFLLIFFIYYHRPIQTKKLIGSGYWPLSSEQTKFSLVKRYRYHADTSGWRKIRLGDTSAVCKLLKYPLFLVFLPFCFIFHSCFSFSFVFFYSCFVFLM